MLSKEASSTIFKVFGMTRPEIEPRPPEPLVDTLTIIPIQTLCHVQHMVEGLGKCIYLHKQFLFFKLMPSSSEVIRADKSTMIEFSPLKFYGFVNVDKEYYTVFILKQIFHFSKNKAAILL